MFCVVLTVKAEPVYVSPVPAVVVATPVHAPLLKPSTWPFDPANNEVVEIAVGTAEPPVRFAHKVFAAMDAKLMEAAVPPT
jgi:hypothetical protein